MIKVTVGDFEYSYDFAYFKENYKDTDVPRKYPSTMCFMGIWKDGVQIDGTDAVVRLWEGFCWDDGDKYSKPVGRKYALTKVLKTLDIPKEHRRLIWEALWKATNYRYE